MLQSASYHRSLRQSRHRALLDRLIVRFDREAQTFNGDLSLLLAEVAVSNLSLREVRSLYIGTSDGRVLVYPVLYNHDTNHVSTVFERERALGHGKKPVTDIIVLDDVGIILTLCGTRLWRLFKTCSVVACWSQTFSLPFPVLCCSDGILTLLIVLSFQMAILIHGIL